MTDFTLSKMIEGFLLSKTAQGLSVHTIANYRHFLDKFASSYNMSVVGAVLVPPPLAKSG